MTALFLESRRTYLLACASLACLSSFYGCAEDVTMSTRYIGAAAGAGGSAGTTGAGGSAGAHADAGGSSGGAAGSQGGGAGSSPGIAGSSGAPGGISPGGGGSSGGSGGSSAGQGGSAGAGTGGAAGSGSTTRAWRPFNDASPWNTPIPKDAPIDPNSNALIADLAVSAPSIPYLWVNIQEYSIPVFWADAATPRRNVAVTLLAGQGFGSGATGSAQVPIPAGAMPAAGTDRHLCIVDKEAHTEWGMWDVSSAGDGWTSSVAATTDLSGTGVRPTKAGNPTWWTSHGARACGFPLIAGLVTVEEIQKGRIDHALVIAYPHVRSHWYTPPASTAQGTGGQAQPTRGVPCGGRIQLDPSIDVNALPLSASGKVIARALQEYGAFVGDFAGAVTFYADASPDALAVWNAGLLKNDELASLAFQRLRVLTIGTMFEDDN
jgi:hypothetical protein